MKTNNIDQLRDWLMMHVNCSLGYKALEYWVRKYWENPEEELTQLKKLGACDHKVLLKI